MKATTKNGKATKGAKATSAERLSLKDAIAKVKSGTFANGMQGAIALVLNVAQVRQARYEARAAARAKAAKRSNR